MIFVLIFFIELLILWRLSRRVISYLYRLLPKAFFAFLFLPGTFIHELSHFIAAKLLFVPVHKFTLKPEFFEKEVVLGSVSIEKKDIFRRLLIGSSPVFLGLAIVLGSIYLTISKGIYNDWRVIIGICYISFTVGNSMFSSKKDMEGAWKVGIFSLIVLVIFYFLGIRIHISPEGIFIERILEMIKLASIYLLAPIAIDVITIWALSLNKNKNF